jgi:acid phosphatase family membrane protein YuiD
MLSIHVSCVLMRSIVSLLSTHVSCVLMRSVVGLLSTHASSVLMRSVVGLLSTHVSSVFMRSVVYAIVVVFDLTSSSPTEWLQVALELNYQLQDNTLDVKMSKPIT